MIKRLRAGSKKTLSGVTPVKVVQDHGNGAVTVDINGRYIVVNRGNLR